MAKADDASSARLGAAFLAGALVAVGLGVPFALAEVYNPSALFGVVFPVLYAAITAGAAVSIGRAQGIASERALLRLAVAVTFAGYLSSWIPWESFTLGRLGVEVSPGLLLHPGAFFDGLALLYEGGAWTVGSAHADGAVAGPALAAIWVIEAAIVVAIGYQSARSSIRARRAG